MKVLNIACNNCGGPLEVPKKVRYLTCSFCDSRLEVQKSGSAYYTNVLEAVQDIRHDVETLKLQNQLSQIDREWGQERSTMMVRGQHGHSSVPSQFGAIVIMILPVIFLAVVFSITPMSELGGSFGIFVLPVVFVVAIGFWHFNKAKRYEERKRHYQQRRRKLMRELSGR